MDLLTPDATTKSIERFTKHPLFKGMRHLIHEKPDPHWLLQEPVYESLNLLAAAGLTFDVVATKHEHLECLPVIGEKAPALRMVIDHLGQPPFQADDLGQWGEDIRIAAANLNVYAKISGLGTASGDWEGWTAASVRKIVHWTIDLFGAERCMLGGTGRSRCWPAATSRHSRLTNRSFPSVRLAEQEQISHKTATAFYALHLPG